MSNFVQFVGGVGLVAGSAAGEFGSGGLGTALVVGGVVLSADEMWTGGNKIWTGLDRNSLTFMAAEKACQAAGGENCASKAAWADFGLKFGTNIGLLGLSSNASRVGVGASRERYNIPVPPNGRPIELVDGYFIADNFKIQQIYYDKLWLEGGRKAPFLVAREILESNPKISIDPRGYAGYFKYEIQGLEMIYNPATGHLVHIAPTR